MGRGIHFDDKKPIERKLVDIYKGAKTFSSFGAFKESKRPG